MRCVRGGKKAFTLTRSLSLSISLLLSSKNHPNYSSNFSLQLVVRLCVFTFPINRKRGLIQQAEVELTNLCRLHTAHNTQRWAGRCVCVCLCAGNSHTRKRCSSMLSQKCVCVCACVCACVLERERTTACMKIPTFAFVRVYLCVGA